MRLGGKASRTKRKKRTKTRRTRTRTRTMSTRRRRGSRARELQARSGLLCEKGLGLGLGLKQEWGRGRARERRSVVAPLLQRRCLQRALRVAGAEQQCHQRQTRTRGRLQPALRLAVAAAAAAATAHRRRFSRATTSTSSTCLAWATEALKTNPICTDLALTARQMRRLRSGPAGAAPFSTNPTTPSAQLAMPPIRTPRGALSETARSTSPCSASSKPSKSSTNTSPRRSRSRPRGAAASDGPLVRALLLLVQSDSSRISYVRCRQSQNQPTSSSLFFTSHSLHRHHFLTISIKSVRPSAPLLR